MIEDKFCAGRPDWDKVGATFTEHVHAYEAMKIRILNGGHQLLANAGEILSVDYISGCMQHPLIGDFFRKVAREEISHQVKAVPGMTPEAYIELIDRRFSNPKIVDTVRRVAFDGSSRHPGFILPTLRASLASGTPISGLALSQALWARMCAGFREDGSQIEPNDPMWGGLSTAAQSARETPAAWLDQRDLYGDLRDNAAFGAEFNSWLEMIWSDGTEAALRTYLQE